MLSICLQYSKSEATIQNKNAWIVGAIHHHFCAYVNKKENNILDFADDKEGFEFVQKEEDPFVIESKQLLYNEILNLDSPYKEILEYKLYQEKSYAEIADLMNLTEPNIRKIVSRGTKKITENLKSAVTILFFVLLNVLETQL